MENTHPVLRLSLKGLQNGDIITIGQPGLLSLTFFLSAENYPAIDKIMNVFGIALPPQKQLNPQYEGDSLKLQIRVEEVTQGLVDDLRRLTATVRTTRGHQYKIYPDFQTFMNSLDHSQ